MVIDLTVIDRTNFIVTEHILDGEKLYLVIPRHIGCNWDANNLIFRSSVWNVFGEPVSLSFKKFFNWSEHPELTPPITSLKHANLPEKIDGSTLCISKYKGKFIIRTRGTIDATLMEKNGHEVDELMVKYPKVKEFFGDVETADFTLIFEWVSPLNIICIRYDVADIYLTGIVNHADYSYRTQNELDAIALKLGVKRPQMFKFNTIEEMLATVETFSGKEGIVVYFNGDQSLLKLKGLAYLALHRMKSALGNIDGVVELYMALGGNMSYNEFYQHIVDNFDYELAEFVRGFISKVIDAKKETDKIISHMQDFIKTNAGLIRKDFALKVISAYGNTNRTSFLFTLKDNGQLTTNQKKKLIFQSM